jgi:hypothetical protein
MERLYAKIHGWDMWKYSSTCDCYNENREKIFRLLSSGAICHIRLSGRKLPSRINLLPQSSELKPWRWSPQVSTRWQKVTFQNTSIVCVVETSNIIQTLADLRQHLRPGRSQVRRVEYTYFQLYVGCIQATPAETQTPGHWNLIGRSMVAPPPVL